MAKKKPKAPSYNGFYVEKYYPTRRDDVSKVVHDFLMHWLYHSENHKYYGDSKFKKRGLCQGLVEYFKDYQPIDEHMVVDDYVKELRAMFVEDGLDEAFPFTNGIKGYLAEEDCFRNEKRKNWVKKRLDKEDARKRAMFEH